MQPAAKMHLPHSCTAEVGLLEIPFPVHSQHLYRIQNMPSKHCTEIFAQDHVSVERTRGMEKCVKYL
eukprot:Gb_30656 [translate_table: standard]